MGRTSLGQAHVGGSDTVAIVNGRLEMRPPTYMTLTPADLCCLLLNMDTVVTMDSVEISRDSLLIAIDTIVARNGGRWTGTNSGTRQLNVSWADDLLSDAVRRDFEDVLMVFVETPTLTSTFPDHDARALYRLGQYLFMLNRPYLAYAINHRSRPVASEIITQAGFSRDRSKWQPHASSMFDVQQRKLRP